MSFLIFFTRRYRLLPLCFNIIPLSLLFLVFCVDLWLISLLFAVTPPPILTYFYSIFLVIVKYFFKIIKIMKCNIMEGNFHFYSFTLMLCCYRLMQSPYIRDKDLAKINEYYHYCYYQSPYDFGKLPFFAGFRPGLVITITFLVHSLLFNFFFSLIIISFFLVFKLNYRWLTEYYIIFCLVAASLTFSCFPQDPVTQFFNFLSFLDETYGLLNYFFLEDLFYKVATLLLLILALLKYFAPS